MNTKRKIKYAVVFLSLALPIFLAVFFVFNEKAWSSEGGIDKGDIIINELMWMGMGSSTSDEWLELKNTTAKLINLDECQTVKVIDDKEIIVTASLKDQTISPKDYFVISYKTRDDSKINTDTHKALSYLSLSNTTLRLILKCSGNIIDTAGDGKIPFAGENSLIKKSMERNDIFTDGAMKYSWHTCSVAENIDANTTDCATPGAENSKLAEKIPESPKVYSDKIQITELFPNPFQAQYEEYIELYNGTAEKVDLAGWTLHDASKTGKYTFPVGFLIKAKEYLAIFKKDFKFALNNSGDERVTLFDPNGKEVSKALYDGSKRNLSYNFDGNRWRWSKFLTPGAENILNSEPYGTLKIDDDVYENVYANFSISTGDSDGDSVKVTWDFGDGHKSYLLKTRHKYLATGKYLASVKLTDGSEETLKEFEVEVQKIPHPKVALVAVKANPKGKDSEFETLTIKNNSKKKINLKGWSIATGTKKLANHPIKESVVIKKGKAKEITRQVSSFSLNNKKAKVELRYPDGKIASKLKYDHGKVSIAEDEVYEKTKGGWVWIEKISNDKSQIPNKSQDAIDNIQNSIDNSQDTIEDIQNTIDSEWEGERKGVGLPLWESNSQGGELVNIELLKNQPAVLGAEMVREVGGQYFFTSQVEQKHYLVSFFENLLASLNVGMNQMLNYF